MAKIKKNSFHIQRVEQLRHIMLELPEFCFDYFVAIEPNTSLLTRIQYGYDFKLFFTYLHDNIHGFSIPIREFTVEHIQQLKAQHLDAFLEYLNLYENADGIQRENTQQGKKRKLCAIRSLMKYLHKRELISNNVSLLVDLPRPSAKTITYLTPVEIITLLDRVESGLKLSKHDDAYHQHHRERDLAILTLLLGTGIRISECVGMDLADIDMKNLSFRVTRKGGDESILYFDDEVKQALLPYYERRLTQIPLNGHEQALFLSLQMKRITARTIQLLVRKYAGSAVPLKHITPHKFRSTFGTSLYQNTGDIYLVADVLGHKDINVTRKHYASMDEEKRRRMAANTVSLRPGKQEKDTSQDP